MPIDNDYFKNRQNNSGNNNNGGGGNFEPPFEPPEFFKNLGKMGGMIYLIIGIVVLLIIEVPCF